MARLSLTQCQGIEQRPEKGSQNNEPNANGRRDAENLPIRISEAAKSPESQCAKLGIGGKKGAQPNHGIHKRVDGHACKQQGRNRRIVARRRETLNEKRYNESAKKSRDGQQGDAAQDADSRKKDRSQDDDKDRA